MPYEDNPSIYDLQSQIADMRSKLDAETTALAAQLAQQQQSCIEITNIVLKLQASTIKIAEQLNQPFK